jgi:hypothetical protein
MRVCVFITQTINFCSNMYYFNEGMESVPLLWWGLYWVIHISLGMVFDLRSTQPSEGSIFCHHPWKMTKLYRKMLSWVFFSTFGYSNWCNQNLTELRWYSNGYQIPHINRLRMRVTIQNNGLCYNRATHKPIFVWICIAGWHRSQTRSTLGIHGWFLVLVFCHIVKLMIIRGFWWFVYAK